MISAMKLHQEQTTTGSPTTNEFVHKAQGIINEKFAKKGLTMKSYQ